jgi:hypothetical protein
MNKILGIAVLLVFVLAACSLKNDSVGLGPGPAKIVNTNAPASVVKLIFIHHSVGMNWLATGNGNLGAALNNNNYFVNEAYYGWNDPPCPPAQFATMGDNTDTGHWPFWFTNTVMPYVYDETNNHPSYANTISRPAGENEIIMFKSCYPNSDVGASIDDEKQIYVSLLRYFGLHTDKMFVLIVPSPMQTISFPSNTRKLANWLTDTGSGWLSGYSHGNVFVFDLYNVMTDPGNHHKITNGCIVHTVTTNPANPAHPDELYYPSGDDHPNSTGNQKATAEFVPLLNAYYHFWKGN